MGTTRDEYFVIVGFERAGSSLTPVEVTFLTDEDTASCIIEDDADELAAVCLYRLTASSGQPGSEGPVLVESRGDVPVRWRNATVDDIFSVRLD